MTDREGGRLPTGRLSPEGFLCFPLGCSVKLGTVFLFSGRESSTAFRAERFDTRITSRKRLDAALPQFQFLISDPGGCCVSNELGVCASVRGIGLLTSPGQFHGLAVVLENLNRLIKRLARKLSEDRP